MIPTVRQPACWNAPLSVNRSLEVRLRQRRLLSIQSPDSSVACASPLPEPTVDDVR
jgi:hypothetical protein